MFTNQLTLQMKREKKWEEHESNIYRIFCCFDEGNLVILFNAFQKKTQKTPQTEIERAKRIKEEYFRAKEQLNK